MGEKKRAKTRGQSPEDRHDSEYSLMLCATHHREGVAAYDLNRMTIEALTENGCNGRLRFTRDGQIWEEPV